VARTRNGTATANRPIGVVVMLSVLTKAGVYFALIRAHDVGHTEASIAVNRNAVPLAQRIALEEPASGDLNIRVAQGDDIAQAATSKGHARTASELAEKQDKARAQLVTQRQAIAERIAKLMEEQAGIKARKESWPRKSAQEDRWSFCLTAGTLCPANQEIP